jgi:hypothetical protein
MTSDIGFKDQDIKSVVNHMVLLYTQLIYPCRKEANVEDHQHNKQGQVLGQL